VSFHDRALATGFPQAAHLARIATVASAIYRAKFGSATLADEVE
jgi:hypothetical protein